MIALDRRGFPLTASLALLARPTWAADPPLHLVLTPSQKPTDLLATGEEFGKVLSRLTGVPVRVTVASDYAAVIEALRNRTADLAFVHPGGYVLASREAKATIVVRNLWHGKSSFTSRIFVLKESGIKSVEELRGRTIAFVDPASSSGYIYPMVLLIQRGLVKNRDPKTFFKEVVFSGAHDASMRALLNGHVDAIASFDLAREQYLPNAAERERIVFVAETPEIPEAGICARAGLDPAPSPDRGAAADPRPRVRGSAQAPVRDRRVRDGRGPRLRSGAGRHRAARSPSSLIRPRARHPW
jgi:phosphonate transport system substrate-binding protein